MVVGEFSTRTDLVVVGAGPAGIAAAARGRELGLDVTLVDHPRPLDPADAGDRAAALERLRAAGATVMPGAARFDGGRQMTVAGNEQVSRVRFRRAILAAGPGPALPPALAVLREAGDRRIVVAGGADPAEWLLEHEDDARLLAWGGRPEVIESVVLESHLLPAEAAGEGPPPPRHLLAVPGPRLLPGARPGAEDDVEAWAIAGLAARGIEVRTGVDPGGLEEADGGLRLAGEDATFAAALVAADGPPALADLGLEATDVEVDARGFVVADAAGRTADTRILAAGRVRGPEVDGAIRTAAVAAAEGGVAAGTAAGREEAFEPQVHGQSVWAGWPLAWTRRLDLEAIPAGERARLALAPGDPARAAEPHLREARILWERSTGLVLAAAVHGAGADAAIAACAAVIEMGGVLDDLAALTPPGGSSALAGLARRALDGAENAAAAADHHAGTPA